MRPRLRKQNPAKYVDRSALDRDLMILQQALKNKVPLEETYNWRLPNVIEEYKHGIVDPLRVQWTETNDYMQMLITVVSKSYFSPFMLQYTALLICLCCVFIFVACIQFYFDFKWHNEWVASNRDTRVCAKNSGIVRRQTLPVARRKCVAKSCFEVQENDFWERSTLFNRRFYREWIWVMLICGVCKFLFE